MRLNLARRPFVNLRPVRRTTVLLWALGTMLLVGNVLLYQRHFAGQGEKRELQQRVDEATEIERARIDVLQAELAGLDLEWQNEQVDFINQKIAERTFSWSSLFDDFEEVLPIDVRLTRLTPGGGRRRPGRQGFGRGREAPGEAGVFLQIAGEARQGESLLAFLESLFVHPSFQEPSLLSESTGENGLIAFSLTALYRPAAAAEPAAEVEDAGPEPADAGSEPADAEAADEPAEVG